MEKRVIVFLVLAVAVIFAWDLLLKEFGLAPPPPIEQAREADKTQGDVQRPPGDPGDVSIQESSKDARSADTPTARHAEDKQLPRTVDAEESLEVVTPLYRAVFTNRGGEIKSWELLKYFVSVDEKRPVQVVHAENKFRRPLSVQVPNSGLDKELREALYEVEKDFTSLDASHPTGHITFRYAAPNLGVRIQKRLTFHHDRYLIDVDVTAEGLSVGFDVALGTNFGIVEWGEGFIGLIGPASVVDDKLVKDTPDTVEERKGVVRWLALQDKYFISVLIPANAVAVKIAKEADKLVSAQARFPGGKDSQTASVALYAGPKEYDTLRAMNLGLEDTIDFGWFIYGSWDIVRAVAKPLFYVLRFFHEYTHNYGVAIILLTVCIKLWFVPLQYKSYKSMKDMQLIQPKVAALQQKLKDDKERLNKELIKLYREHKVNPVGGCLPMLLQTPVFVALFNILYMTIDLRQAPFLLWIKDLSVQDPYYVLPI